MGDMKVIGLITVTDDHNSKLLLKGKMILGMITMEELYKRYKEVEYRVCKLEYTVNGLITKIDKLEHELSLLS